ncbi:MAG: 4-hydroxybenzoate polyprenyltransferase [Betaproteobacteria bacterium RIFCSPLOWO2_12_FULL_66_14]|nr:MAG: 4-hydroxybenzoate polyprenyltransferase [Betaproteobacteria bacterium RIFCSPLOWO2_12_FULL_66_14]
MNAIAIKERLDLYERLMRLDKPIGTLLLLWPTLWAVWMGGHGRPQWHVVAIFVLGTLLMRSAGCVMNDIADRKLDPHVKRTRERPLAAGRVSVHEALMLAAVLSLLAFLLVLNLNALTVQLSFVALFIAATYPLFKRFFAIPQAYLGVAFGFGIPMGFAAQLDTVPPIGWWLLAANILWAIAYDTEYAMVDRDDDLRIGIRTSAITFGRYDVLAVMACYAGMLAILVGIGLRLHWGIWYYLGLAVAAVMMARHYVWIRGRSREGCFRAFNHNNWVGGAIFAGIALDYAVHGPW